MLVFNLTRVLNLRGIDAPFAFLVKIGLTRSIAYNLTNYKVANIKIAHLEKLCRALNCTPNDLFDWKPDANETLAESHSLKSLKRDKPAPRLSQIIKDIPVEKLDRIEDLLKQLKEE
jgi:DNA-binding Xre family transcriptional regulator